VYSIDIVPGKKLNGKWNMGVPENVTAFAGSRIVEIWNYPDYML